MLPISYSGLILYDLCLRLLISMKTAVQFTQHTIKVALRTSVGLIINYFDDPLPEEERGLLDSFSHVSVFSGLKNVYLSKPLTLLSLFSFLSFLIFVLPIFVVAMFSSFLVNEICPPIFSQPFSFADPELHLLSQTPNSLTCPFASPCSPPSPPPPSYRLVTLENSPGITPELLRIFQNMSALLGKRECVILIFSMRFCLIIDIQLVVW